MTTTLDDLDIFFGRQIKRIRETTRQVNASRHGTTPASPIDSGDQLIRRAYLRRETVPKDSVPTNRRHRRGF